jgi:putative transposase
MPRKLGCRHRARDAASRLLSRGHHREAVVTDPADGPSFLHLRAGYRPSFDFRLDHSCLVTNHGHLLLHRDNPRWLSALMAGRLLPFVRYCNRRHGLVGHWWQGWFQSPAVPRQSYGLSCGRSMERNPLEAQMVTERWAYAWSSCRMDALGESDPLVTPGRCDAKLSIDPRRRQA